jgi:predicted glutamine amidotransferase
MCRLLGYCTRANASLAQITGERGLRDFTGLSAFHGDGWGMAACDGQQMHVEKSSLRAADEPAYDELAHRALGDAGLVHLRMATPGLPVEARNSHPFRRGGFAMAHNGAIHPQHRLGSLLPPAWERHVTGTTDSERYFLHVMSCLEARDGDVIAAIDDTAAHIDRNFSANSLNAILLAPDALYAISCYDPERIPFGGLAARGYDGPPERYFDLAYRETEDAVVVASTGWPQDGWTFVPNRHVLAVERDTLRVKVEPLSRRSATSAPLPVLVAVTGRPQRTVGPPAGDSGISSQPPSCAERPPRPGAARSRERVSCARAAATRRPPPRSRSRVQSPGRRRTRRSAGRRSGAACRSWVPFPSAMFTSFTSPV